MLDATLFINENINPDISIQNNRTICNNNNIYIICLASLAISIIIVGVILFILIIYNN